MQTLWAPWREAYISKIPMRKKSCVFCRILAEKKDAQNLIFIRSAHAYAVLNLYPYSSAHCLIVANRHVADLNQLTPQQYHELMDLLLKTKKILEQTFKPQGFNIGLNLGRVAGAGIPKHVHLHLVPRWKGDHNFMPVVAGTRVMAQSLTSVYKKIIHAQPKRHRRAGS